MAPPSPAGGDLERGKAAAPSPCSDHCERQGTFLSSVVTLSAWAMGCGVLALPHVFADCGPRWGIALVATFALWVDLSLRWTVACGRYSGRRGFQDNARFFLGDHAAQAVHAGQVVLLFGGIVAVFLTSASLLACSGQEVLACLCDGDLGGSGAGAGRLVDPLRLVCRAAHPVPCMSKDRVLVLVAFLMFPLSCQKSLHALRGISTVSLACLAYFFVILVGRVALALRAGMAGDGSLAFPGQEAGASEGSFWQGPPVVLMSFLCHTSILQLDEELRPDARRQVGSVIDTVILRAALPCYVVVGLGGYWLCGASVSSNVLEDFGGDAWMAAARLMLGLMNVAKIPTAAVMLREALTSSLPCPQLRRKLRSASGRAVSAAVLLSCGAGAATAMGSLSRVLSLLGCTVGVLFSLNLPAALYARLLWDFAAKQHLEKDDLRRPLMGVRNLADGRADCLAGALALPQTPIAWVLHWATCATVFVGGLLVGGLGLAGWLAKAGS